MDIENQLFSLSVIRSWTRVSAEDVSAHARMCVYVLYCDTTRSTFNTECILQSSVDRRRFQTPTALRLIEQPPPSTQLDERSRDELMTSFRLPGTSTTTNFRKRSRDIDVRTMFSTCMRVYSTRNIRLTVSMDYLVSLNRSRSPFETTNEIAFALTIRATILFTNGC